MDFTIIVRIPEPRGHPLEKICLHKTWDLALLLQVDFWKKILIASSEYKAEGDALFRLASCHSELGIWWKGTPLTVNDSSPNYNIITMTWLLPLLDFSTN